METIIMETQMEMKMENEMEYIGVIFLALVESAGQVAAAC